MKPTLIILLLGLLSLEVHSQCGPNVPSFTVDLSANPDTTWLSPFVVRDDTCCGATAPDKCVEFVLTLHPSAQGIIFDVCDGALPPGALFYQIGCGPPIAVGNAICLNGPGPHTITFCKPGNNNNVYCITSIPAPSAGPDIAVNDGCQGQIAVAGLHPDSITWTSVFPGATGAYNTYLSCTTCDTVDVVAQPGYPAYVDYQVCGTPLGGCSTTPQFCDTVRTYFNSTLSATINPLNPAICFGATSTNLTAIGGGGTPPYTYHWSTGDTAQVIPVGVGTYWVEISDTSGCPPVYDTVTVTSFANTIQALAGNDTVICEQNPVVNLNGSVIAASGGVWGGGTGVFAPNDSDLNATYTPSASELAAGTVTLSLTTTGNGSCPPDTDYVSIQITTFGANVLPIQQNVSCWGLSDAYVILSLSGGNTPHNFLWSSGSTNNSALNLSAGQVQVTIEDNFGCFIDTSFLVTEPSPLNVDSIFFTPVSCNGGSDGSAQINVSGATAPYGYTWTNGSTNSISGNLSAGSAAVTVSDANGCSLDTFITITEPTALVLGGSLNNVLCNGGSSGNATVNAIGGTAGYGYLWSSNANSSTDSTASGLAIGNYSVTVTDANGCSADTNFTIAEPTPLTWSGLSVFNVDCFGNSTGSASATAQGGTPNYTYQWGVNSGNQQGQNATQLAAGTYSVSATDANGCVLDSTITITQPQVLATTTSFVEPTCFGFLDGSATVSITGGTGPFQYLWDQGTGFQTDSTAINLGSGTYAVNVTDANGCVSTSSVSITQPTSVAVQYVSADVSCNGGSDGSITITASGGTPTYTYLWSNGAAGPNDPSATSLAAGVYQVTVEDANGCQFPILDTIFEPSVIGVSLNNVSDVTICAGDTFLLDAIANGGTQPYSYTWSDASFPDNPNQQVAPLNSITYSVTVTDINNCPPAEDTIRITVINIFDDFIDVTNTGPICFGDDVDIEGFHNGVEGPFVYSWNTLNETTLGPHTDSPDSTLAYILTATDQCNNSISDTTVVTVFPLPSVDLDDTLALGCPELVVQFSPPTDGEPGTQYTWTFGNSVQSGSNPVFTYSNTGVYEVFLSAISAQGCSNQSTDPSYVIVVPAPIAIIEVDRIVTQIDDPGFQFYNSSIDYDSWEWLFEDNIVINEQDPYYLFQDTGSFTTRLIVSNAYGCTDSAYYIVEVGPTHRFDVPNAFTPVENGSGGAYNPFDLSNDVFFVWADYVSEYHLMIFNRWGELVFESKDQEIGWDGTYKGQPAQQDVYVWKAAVTYTDGIKKSGTGDLTLIR